MNKTFLVFKQELISTIARKSFLVMLFLIPLAGFIVMLIASNLQKNNQTTQITQLFSGTPEIEIFGIVDQSGIIKNIPDQYSKQFQSFDTEDAAKNALNSGKISSYYIISKDYVTSGSVIKVSHDVNPLNSSAQPAELEDILTVNLLNDQPDLAQRIVQPLNLETEYLSPTPQRDPTSLLTYFLPYIVTMLFYIVIMTSASLMLSSVTKEKENRVLEILMTSISPTQMLVGKIFALGLAGLLQTIVWTGSGLLLLKLSGSTMNVSSAFQLPVSFMIWGLLFFLAGYFLYASLMAGIGALVPNLREASQTTFIVIMPLILPLMLINVLINQPNGAISVFLSMFPFTSPVVMMTRISATQVPFWQIAIALALSVTTALITMKIISNFFRSQTLISGQKYSTKLFFKALVGIM